MLQITELVAICFFNYSKNFQFLLYHFLFLIVLSKKRSAEAEHFSFIKLSETSFVISDFPLSAFPAPFLRSPTLPSASAHLLHLPTQGVYKCSMSFLCRYAPSNIGASLDSCPTLPYCYSNKSGNMF